MKILSAKYLISNQDWRKCPSESKPEYAFIGRSNVGKSSLINMLTGNRSLAKTSATPGKTLLINHFVINDSWFLVDLPGYGYAKRGKDSRARLWQMITDYVLNREQLTMLFVLVDSRHKPQQIDLDFITFLGEHSVPFSLIFTKMDKLGVNAGKKNVAAYKRELMQSWEELPPIFETSSIDGRGRDQILDYIERINTGL